MELLKAHAWPGNIRELENVIEHAFVIESGTEITPSSLPDTLTGGRSLHTTAQDTSTSETDDDDLLSDESDGDGDESIATIQVTAGPVGAAIDINRLDFQASKEEFERQFLISALKAFKGRINQTALHANIPKKTLLRKLQKYGITARDYN